VPTVSRPGIALQSPSTAGFTSVPNAVDDLGLTPREEQLVKRLLKHRWTPESTIFVRIAVLAESMHCHRRTVERALDSLVGRGLLTVEARYRDDGGRAANRYVLSPLLTHYLTSEGRYQDVAGSGPPSRTPATFAPRQEDRPRKQTQRTGQTGVGYDVAAWLAREQATYQEAGARYEIRR
jgi:DNA-binding transcriptional MocR family regulator